MLYQGHQSNVRLRATHAMLGRVLHSRPPPWMPYGQPLHECTLVKTGYSFYLRPLIWPFVGRWAFCLRESKEKRDANWVETYGSWSSPWAVFEPSQIVFCNLKQIYIQFIVDVACLWWTNMDLCVHLSILPLFFIISFKLTLRLVSFNSPAPEFDQ